MNQFNFPQPNNIKLSSQQMSLLDTFMANEPYQYAVSQKDPSLSVMIREIEGANSGYVVYFWEEGSTLSNFDISASGFVTNWVGSSKPSPLRPREVIDALPYTQKKSKEKTQAQLNRLDQLHFKCMDVCSRAPKIMAEFLGSIQRDEPELSAEQKNLFVSLLESTPIKLAHREQEIIRSSPENDMIVTISAYKYVSGEHVGCLYLMINACLLNPDYVESLEEENTLATDKILLDISEAKVILVMEDDPTITFDGGRGVTKAYEGIIPEKSYSVFVDFD